MMEGRKYIDAVRTFANYAIVLMHAWAAQTYVTRGTWEYKSWDFICNAVTAAVMPALFLMSGYLLAKGYEHFSLAWWKEKLTRRVKRLLVPYLAWNALFVGFYLVASHAVPRLHQRVVAFGLTTWKGAISKVISFMANPIDMPTWFMRTLLVYVLVAVVLAPLLKKRKGVVAYLLLAGWFVFSWQMKWGARMCFTYPFYSILAFTIGMHLSLANKSPFEIFKSRWLAPLAVVGMAGLFLHNIRWHWDYSPVRDISFLMMMPLMFCLGPTLGRVADKIKCWKFVKDSSFFLYTGHFLFCSMVLHSLGPLLGFWQGPGKLTFLIVVFCTLGVVVNLSAYWLGKRVLGKVFGVFDGTL